MRTRLYYILALAMLLSCKKSFLDAKPSTNIIIPQTLGDFRSLLDNTTNLNFTSGLGQMAADDYVFVDYKLWQGTFTEVERNSYIWAKDIFEGRLEIGDWNRPYVSIFYANNALKGLEKFENEPVKEVNELKGWATFIRAFSLYDLATTFAKAYDPSTSNVDLGVPLRLNPEIDEMADRASVEQTYSQIISDLKNSCALLGSQFLLQNRNRPSKGTAYAMLARVYLSMNKYVEAELYADSALSLYDRLIDYNNISLTNATPFGANNDEVLFSTSQIGGYNITANAISNTAVTINPELISLYSQNDLRLPIYFTKNTLGNYYAKRGYLGAGNFPFTGLANDEVYLIKSECLARRNEIDASLVLLNTLLRKRYTNTVPYVPITAISKDDAIDKILLERRKELVWRGVRWGDIKRLNKTGKSISLKRILNGIEYTLGPNDQKFALPIPSDEISRSGIKQNPR